ncbi:phage_term_2, phage terminase, large subunit, PBSX family [uncultured Caudovirales phage]|uniref:Phage_term_2, phage terminase, large subunit, PBSX family n=1 Tax=uncultured Caudovirales phage TaxID=2100421 RepID=A0A6J7WJB7_9CAUD|nr:phage_term_2, phage terminase, large subunit, PBSX family [uncultured Caudovirales phage]
MAAEINLTPKQSDCWELLFDKEHTEILYGGSAGSGKSWLGCLWISTLCLKYPGIRCLIGRTVLAQLKTTTLNTLFETFKALGMDGGKHYTYNAHSNIITFKNKSEIILKDLQAQPSDPNFDSLAGLELSACFVDEASQVVSLVPTILKSRLRYKLDEFDLIPKLFMTCNPGQNFLKKDFYIPHTQGVLDPRKAFIPALPTDNPHLPDSYIEILQSLPIIQRRRLLEGDWNYMEEDDALFNFDSISNSIFKMAPNPNNRRFMTIDVSRFGADRSVVMIWNGLVLIECKIFRKLDTTQLAAEIEELIEIYQVHRNSILVDSDGVGGGVADMIKGINFVNNSKALFGQNFSNLKSQCYVKLSEMFKEGKLSLNLVDNNLIDELTQELLAVKLKDIDKDNKVGIQSKDEMKKMLGRSPDLGDALSYRMYFELKNIKSTGRYAIQFTNYG